MNKTDRKLRDNVTLFVWFVAGVMCGWLAVVGGLVDFLLWRLVMALP